MDTAELHSLIVAAGYAETDVDGRKRFVKTVNGNTAHIFDRKGLTLPTADNWAVSIYAENWDDEAHTDWQHDDDETYRPRDLLDALVQGDEVLAELAFLSEVQDAAYNGCCLPPENGWTESWESSAVTKPMLGRFTFPSKDGKRTAIITITIDTKA